jgi:hypothetical protein
MAAIIHRVGRKSNVDEADGVSRRDSPRWTAATLLTWEAPPVSDSLEQGRTALGRRSWPEAFEQLTAADGAQGLSPKDLEGLALAARCVGRMTQCIAVSERAYTAYLNDGNRRRAGFVALGLARDFLGRRNPSVGKAWLQRAERLL